MNRINFVLGLAISIFTGACGANGEAEGSVEEFGQTRAALSTSFDYFICNATGWQPGEGTLLESVGGGDSVIEYDVTEQWMVDQGDQCVHLTTDELNGWGTEQTWRGAFKDTEPPVVSFVEVPDWARLSGEESFTVKYPALGRYRMTRIAARGAFNIEAVE